MGKVNRSPEDCFSWIIFFENSTPINPPNNPPIIDFVLSNCNMLMEFIEINGFSKNPTSLEPIKAPTMAPSMIESLFPLDILSFDELRNLT